MGRLESGWGDGWLDGWEGMWTKGENGGWVGR